jgi:hypothetical protein
VAVPEAVRVSEPDAVGLPLAVLLAEAVAVLLRVLEGLAVALRVGEREAVLDTVPGPVGAGEGDEDRELPEEGVPVRVEDLDMVLLPVLVLDMVLLPVLVLDKVLLPVLVLDKVPLRVVVAEAVLLREPLLDMVLLRVPEREVVGDAEGVRELLLVPELLLLAVALGLALAEAPPSAYTVPAASEKSTCPWGARAGEEKMAAGLATA